MINGKIIFLYETHLKLKNCNAKNLPINIKRERERERESELIFSEHFLQVPSNQLFSFGNEKKYSCLFDPIIPTFDTIIPTFDTIIPTFDTIIPTYLLIVAILLKPRISILSTVEKIKKKLLFVTICLRIIRVLVSSLKRYFWYDFCYEV